MLDMGLFALWTFTELCRYDLCSLCYNPILLLLFFNASKSMGRFKSFQNLGSELWS